MSNNMFEDIYKVKQDLPKLKNIEKEVSKTTLNFYQSVAISIYFICFVLAIVMGNLFPVCTATRGMFDNVCVQTEFNVTLMVFIWVISFVLCLFFYAI